MGVPRLYAVSVMMLKGGELDCGPTPCCGCMSRQAVWGAPDGKQLTGGIQHNTTRNNANILKENKQKKTWLIL